jgi:hypothetical protein
MERYWRLFRLGLLTLPRRPDMLAGRGGGPGSSGRNGCARLVQVTRQPSTKHQVVAARRGAGPSGASESVCRQFGVREAHVLAVILGAPNRHLPEGPERSADLF